MSPDQGTKILHACAMWPKKKNSIPDTGILVTLVGSPASHTRSPSHFPERSPFPGFNNQNGVTGQLPSVPGGDKLWFRESYPSFGKLCVPLCLSHSANPDIKKKKDLFMIIGSKFRTSLFVLSPAFLHSGCQFLLSFFFGGHTVARGNSLTRDRTHAP